MKKGVLLVNLGSPDAPAPGAVRGYLREFLSDPRVVALPRPLWLPLLYAVIAPLRAGKVARAYRSIWTDAGSPLVVHMQRLAGALEEESGMPVVAAMRYGRPGLEAGVEALLGRGVEQVTVLPLYPQYSVTTTATVFDRLAQIMAARQRVPSLCFRDQYHAESAYIGAVAGSIDSYWQANGRPQKLLMSFHGLPEKSRDQGDPYYDQCVRSARLIAARLGLEETAWELVFQSRFGPAEWLRPYCVEVLRRLPEAGVKAVDVVCPGFSVDCLETLEEIAHANRGIFLQAGGRRYRYIPALNAEPGHVRMLKALLSFDGG